ncbi:MAG: 50S ribosomal protein L22 [bacterium]|nr:MAG: 50S ribosomal protein L22 [bacterium]
MEYKSEQKHLIISPRKVRPVVDVIKKMTPLKALENLPFIKKRASEYLYKVIKSAVANASQKGADVNSLIFKEIQIGEGPRLKRGQPVSRGRWHPIKKRMSHIKVILVTKKVAEVIKKKVVKKESNKIEGKRSSMLKKTVKKENKK